MRRVSWAISKAGITPVSHQYHTSITPVGADLLNLPKMKTPQQKWNHFVISENSSKQKLYHFSQKRVKIPRKQKWYHFRKGSKIVNKNGTISIKGQKPSTKIVPFQKMVKITQQKWYYFRKGSKLLNKNGTISEKGQKSSTKNGTISVRKGS